jgi:hypothetical protein
MRGGDSPQHREKTEGVGMSQFQFRKLPRSLIQRKKQDRLFQLAAEDIRKQVEDPPWIPNADRAAAIPPEAQTVYWLWLFVCEARGNGIEAFILNSLGECSPPIHAALTAVGAKEFVRRLEAAIPHARESCAEFTNLPDQSWFNQFAVVAEFPTLQSVDDLGSVRFGVYDLFDSLREAADAYIRSNEHVLFEE